MKEYYEILGLPLGSPLDHIKKQYKKLAAKHHPDKGGDTKKFQEITQAYNILTGKMKPGKHQASPTASPAPPPPKPNPDVKRYTAKDWKKQEEQLLRKKIVNGECLNCNNQGYVILTCEYCYAKGGPCNRHKDKATCFVCKKLLV